MGRVNFNNAVLYYLFPTCHAEAMRDLSHFVEDYYRRFVQVLESFDKAPLEDIAASVVAS